MAIVGNAPTDKLLTSNDLDPGFVTPVVNGGTGRTTSTTAYGLLAAGTTPTGTFQTLATGLTTQVLVGGGASALPVWTAATGTGSPVFATSPTITTPTITSATMTTPVITGLRETKVAMGANDINCALGNYFTKTFSAGSVTITFSNVPSTGTAVTVILDATNAGAATITWVGAGVVKWALGVIPTLTSSNGRDLLSFTTHDGGTTWLGTVIGKDFK